MTIKLNNYEIITTLRFFTNLGYHQIKNVQSVTGNKEQRTGWFCDIVRYARKRRTKRADSDLKENLNWRIVGEVKNGVVQLNRQSFNNSRREWKKDSSRRLKTLEGIKRNKLRLIIIFSSVKLLKFYSPLFYVKIHSFRSYSLCN